MRAIGWIELLLATPVVLWGGWPFFERGWASLVNRSLNMFTLIALGTGTAYVYSVIAVLFPGIFPASFRMRMAQVPVYFEAAAAITALVLLGQVLELRARSRTSAAIRSLLKLSPQNRAPRPRGRHRNRRSHRTHRRGRHAARAPRRKSSGRWRRDRRIEFRGRIA